MSKLEDWASKQLAGMRQGVYQIGVDIASDLGNTYQAFLMSDAGWRVPPAHNHPTKEIALQEEPHDGPKSQSIDVTQLSTAEPSYD